MKKLIYGIVTIAFVATIVSNPIATFAVAADGSDNDKIVLQNISPEVLGKVLSKRLKNPDSYANQSPLFLNLKPNPLSQGVQKALKDHKPLESTAFIPSSKYYGMIKDPATGATFILKKTPADKLEDMSPKKLSHSAALWSATKEAAGPYGMKFGAEAFSFYAGVGANNVLNLLINYEKNPMALEMFAEELKDPIAQVGFFAFMVGNRYAQTVFQDMLARSTNKTLQKTLAPMLGFLAMAVGSTFSNLSHDLITLTKGCAVAFTHVNEPEYDTPEKRAEKCQEGWNAVMTSDNLARYVTSTVSVVAAASLAGILNQGATSLVKQTLPIDEFRLLFRKVFPKGKPIQGLAEVVDVAPAKGLRGFGISIASLVIFLQADELTNPPIYHFVESVLNSGPKLALNRSKVNSLISKLDSRNWADDPNQNQSCHNAIMHASQNRSDVVPQWILNELRSCSETSGTLYDYLQDFHEKNKKWRDTLAYDFMSSYTNWMRFIGEFSVMHDVSKEFFSRLIAYSANKESDIKNGSYSYNPFAYDNPFYGIQLSENLKITDPEDFKMANKSKAQRVVDALPKINEAIALVSKKGYDETLKPLKEIKSLLEDYQKNPTVENQAKVAKAIVMINDLDAQAKSLRRLSGLSHRATYGIYDASAVKNQMILEKKISLLRSIKKFIGNSIPLEKGPVAFYQMFNDWVKAEKPDFVKILSEKGTPADTITWYAVCGNTLEGPNARVDKRRTGFASTIDKVVNVVLKNTIGLKEDVSPALNAFEAIRFGTGVDFYIPKITKGDSTICGADETMLKYIIAPRKNKRKVFKGPDGKKYDSLFTYLENNIKPEVLNIGKADDGAPLGPNFDGWWARVITPKYLKAYDGFIKDYDVLINETYRSAVDGESIRRDSNPFSAAKTAYENMRTGSSNRNNSTMLGFQKVLNMPRSLPTKNASNMVQSYVDEMNTYLQILERVYATAPELAATKNPVYMKNFKNKLFTLKALVYDLLNDFRNYNTKGLTFPTIKEGPDGVPIIVKNASAPMDIQQKYSVILLQLNDVFEALGFSNPYVSAAAPNTIYFKGKNGVETIPPMERLKLRTQTDPAIKDNYDVYMANYKSRSRPELFPLTFGLKEENFNVSRSGVLQNQDVVKVDLINFNSNDRLTMSFIASNELFALLEDIYTNVSILNAARPDTTFRAIEMPKNAPTGHGSRSF